MSNTFDSAGRWAISCIGRKLGPTLLSADTDSDRHCSGPWDESSASSSPPSIIRTIQAKAIAAMDCTVRVCTTRLSSTTGSTVPSGWESLRISCTRLLPRTAARTIFRPPAVEPAHPPSSSRHRNNCRAAEPKNGCSSGTVKWPALLTSEATWKLATRNDCQPMDCPINPPASGPDSADQFPAIVRLSTITRARAASNRNQ